MIPLLCALLVEAPRQTVLVTVVPEPITQVMQVSDRGEVFLRSGDRIRLWDLTGSRFSKPAEPLALAASLAMTPATATTFEAPDPYDRVVQITTEGVIGFQSSTVIATFDGDRKLVIWGGGPIVIAETVSRDGWIYLTRSLGPDAKGIDFEGYGESLHGQANRRTLPPGVRAIGVDAQDHLFVTRSGKTFRLAQDRLIPVPEPKGFSLSQVDALTREGWYLGQANRNGKTALIRWRESEATVLWSANEFIEFVGAWKDETYANVGTANRRSMYWRGNRRIAIKALPPSSGAKVMEPIIKSVSADGTAVGTQVEKRGNDYRYRPIAWRNGEPFNPVVNAQLGSGRVPATVEAIGSNG